MESSICKIEKQPNLVIMTLVLDNLLWDDNIELKKLYNSLLDEGNKNIILDLSNTSYVSSVVLASFVYMLKRAKEAGGNLILCSINPKVREVLSLTNLDKVFDIASDRNEAVAKLGGV